MQSGSTVGNQPGSGSLRLVILPRRVAVLQFWAVSRESASAVACGTQRKSWELAHSPTENGRTKVEPNRLASGPSAKKRCFIRDFGGGQGIRTLDLLDAIEARFQLRHGPTEGMSFYSTQPE